MKTRLLLFCLLAVLAFTVPALAQTHKMEYTEYDKMPRELQAFADPGYQVFHAQYGDLNADGDTLDVLLLLVNDKEGNCLDSCLRVS